MKIAKGIRDAFDQERPNFQRLADEVIPKLQWITNEKGWFLRHRIKELESFALKLETGRVKDPRRLEDFFACTVIVPTFVAVAEAEKDLCAVYSLVERRPNLVSQTHKRASDFVFDDLRLYFKRGDIETGKDSDLSDYVFEVQVKTILQYAWGIATHDLIYKSDNVSWPKERVAFQVKAMLEHAELAIAEVSALAASPIIAMSDRRAVALQQIMGDIEVLWESDRLPKDRKRLAETIMNLLSASDVRPDRFRPLIEAEIKRVSVLPLDLSPYSFTVQALAHSNDVNFEQKLSSADRRFRVLVHGGIELPDWMKKENAHIIQL